MNCAIELRTRPDGVAIGWYSTSGWTTDRRRRRVLPLHLAQPIAEMLREQCPRNADLIEIVREATARTKSRKVAAEILADLIATASDGGPEAIRWTARIKGVVSQGICEHRLDRERAMQLFALSDSELARWGAAP